MKAFLVWWSRRSNALRWGAVVAEMLLLWWTSSRPLIGLGQGLGAALLHNSAHVVAYGAMGAMILMAQPGRIASQLVAVAASDRFPSRQARTVAVAVAAAYGAIDELHQHFVPGRVMSLADLGSDTAGAWLGLAVAAGTLTGESRWWRQAVLATVCSAATVTLASLTDW